MLVFHPFHIRAKCCLLRDCLSVACCVPTVMASTSTSAPAAGEGKATGDAPPPPFKRVVVTASASPAAAAIRPESGWDVVIHYEVWNEDTNTLLVSTKDIAAGLPRMLRLDASTFLWQCPLHFL